MMSLLPMLMTLAVDGPDPDKVKPGWLGFGVFLIMAAVLVLLFFSFRKQLRKVDFDEDAVNKGDGKP
jgi:hypothetical protein